MSKLSKRFEFPYPVIETSVVNGRETKTHLFDLRVEGVGYEINNSQLYDSHPDYGERYDVDIDGIHWEGKNIISLVKATNDYLLEKLIEAALPHVAELFSYENMQDQIASELIDAQIQERA